MTLGKSKAKANGASKQPMLFVEDSPARTFQWPGNARALLESGRDYSGSLLGLLTSLSQDGLLSKMSPVFYPVAGVPLASPLEEFCESTLGSVDAERLSSALSAMPESECLNLIKAETLPSSFAGWQTGGMAFAGGYLTLSTSDWPSDAGVCSLSEVLVNENDPWVRKKFQTLKEFQDWLRKYYLSALACMGI